MKERPILFSTPMVRALLYDGKTQTRRIVKPQPVFTGHSSEKSCSWSWGWKGKELAGKREEFLVQCPYGQPGDRLWVRERIDLVCRDGDWASSCYAADGAPTVADAWPWKQIVLPSIHCPRGLSRINLEITGVRVEQLQDISEADAQAEGCSLECMTPTGDDDGSAIYGPGGYIALWESINGAGSWDANPWVWVVEFKTGMAAA